MKVYKISNDIESIWIVANKRSEALLLANEAYFEDEEDGLMIGNIPDDQILKIVDVGSVLNCDGEYQDDIQELTAKEWASEYSKPTIIGSTLY
jgi:CO dehydrogenase nickel-insertion accessory protein CooC1